MGWRTHHSSPKRRVSGRCFSMCDLLLIKHGYVEAIKSQEANTDLYGLANFSAPINPRHLWRLAFSSVLPFEAKLHVTLTDLHILSHLGIQWWPHPHLSPSPQSFSND